MDCSYVHIKLIWTLWRVAQIVCIYWLRHLYHGLCLFAFFALHLHRQFTLCRYIWYGVTIMNISKRKRDPITPECHIDPLPDITGSSSSCIIYCIILIVLNSTFYYRQDKRKLWTSRGQRGNTWSHRAGLGKTSMKLY